MRRFEAMSTINSEQMCGAQLTLKVVMSRLSLAEGRKLSRGLSGG